MVLRSLVETVASHCPDLAGECHGASFATPVVATGQVR